MSAKTAKPNPVMLARQSKPTKRGGTPAYTILVDTREQKPYDFPDRECMRWGMRTGDYGILEAIGLVAVERKSWADFYGCLAQGRKRFEAELERLSVIVYPSVVVEADHTQLWRPFTRRARGGRTVRSGIPPIVAQKTAISWGYRYRVPIWFCGDRERAAKWTLLLLDNAWRLIERKRKEAENADR